MSMITYHLHGTRTEVACTIEGFLSTRNAPGLFDTGWELAARTLGDIAESIRDHLAVGGTIECSAEQEEALGNFLLEFISVSHLRHVRMLIVEILRLHRASKFPLAVDLESTLSK